MKRILVALVLGVVSMGAQAAVIDYAEPADLDGRPTDLGVFGLGLNTVSGSINACCIENPPEPIDTGDWWTAELPDGYQFDSIGIWISYSSPTPSVATVAYDELGIPGMSGDLWDYQIAGTDGFYLLDRRGFPIVGDLYFGALSFIDEDITGVVYDYRWEIEVSQIPIPAAVWLFGSALGFLGWMRQRQTG